MTKEAPQNILDLETITFADSFGKTRFQDTVPVKDCAVYQFQKCEYLVKRQKGKYDENEFFVWFDELAKQGWELISQPVNLGFYIFKKTA